MVNTKEKGFKMEKSTVNPEVLALVKFLEGQTDDREPLEDRITEARDLIDCGDYLVLTDEEADEKAKEYILDSVWAFNYDFLCGHSDAISNIPKSDYEKIASNLCESFNKAVIAMIDDIDYFISDAIATDSRGHFLSPYDGQENEVKINGVWYFIYRCN